MGTLLDTSVRRDLARAALGLATCEPWRAVTIAKLAQQAGRPVGDLYDATLSDVLDCVEEAFDRAIADELPAVDPDQSVRDRLFDLIMRRFEAMELHRAAVLAMGEGLERDPVNLGLAHGRAARSARWVLMLAGLDAEGVSGQARVQGLAVIITQARAAWKGDKSGDFARTMASLDKNLRRAEEMFGRWGGFGGARQKPQANANDPVKPDIADDNGA